MIGKQYELTQAQDWVPYFAKLFEYIEINSVLEFGLGLGTEFWCDYVSKVKSVELSVSDFNLEWTNKTKEKLKEYDNWECKYISLPQEIIESNQNAIDKKYPLDDIEYLPVLKDIVTPFMKEREYVIIFVDPGIHNRGDIVNFAFGHAPIIACHDSDRTGRVIKNIYGYNIVNPPQNYTEIHKPERYCGTTFWVDKTLKGSEDVVNVIRNS